MSRYPVQGRERKLLGMELDTRQRPTTQAMRDDRNSPDVLYFHSYLLTRTVIGAIGVLLPLTLMLIEGAFAKHGLRPEDSISAYYHTTAGQDVLVGSLCVIAVMLLTYMSGQAKSADFIVSTIAGIALLGVVFFPTNRGADLRGADPRLCGPHTLSEPASCSPTESTFGESTVATIHGICAAVFILGLAALAFVFAYRAHKGNSPTWWGYVVSGAPIIVAALIAVLNFRLGSLSSIYLGEVVALLSFGAAWFLNGEGIRFLLRQPHRGTPA
jgi:hypothetical protein